MKKRSAKERWFWAWIVQATIAKSEQKKTGCILRSLEELCYRPGQRRNGGSRKSRCDRKAEQGDCRGTLRLNGKLAIARFLGISEMGVVHDELADGCEILWQLKKCRQKTAVALPKDRKNLLEEVRRELLLS